MVIVPWTEVIQRDLVVTLKVFDPNVLRQEYSLNLTLTNVVGSEIMHKHNCLNDQTAKGRVTQPVFFAVKKCTLQSAHTPHTCLPKRCVNIRNAEEVIAHVAMKTPHCPLCDWPNKCTIRLTALGESLVDAYLKVPNLTFCMTHKTCRQTSICPTSGKVNCSLKHLPIGAVCKHIVDHCVAIATAIHCILFDMIIGALHWEGNTIHETYDVVHHRFSHPHHIGVFPHLFSIGKFHPCKWMTPQLMHNFFQHPIYQTATNSCGDAKNKAKVFVIHCALQIKQKKTKIPFRS